MLLKKQFAIFTGLIVGACSADVRGLHDREIACPAGSPLIYASSQVVQYPVLINQYFEENTIISVGGVTINISNAPTQVSTTLTATSTVVVTSSVSSSTPSSPSSSILPYAVPPVVKSSSCFFDPTSADSVFSLMDPYDFVPFINIDDIAQKSPQIIDPIPTFNIVPVSGASDGVYDLVMGGKYLAVLDSGMVVFTSISSGGQKYTTSDGQTFITSLFSFACDGLITTGITGLYAYNFGYIDKSGILYATPDCDSCNPITDTGSSKRSADERPHAIAKKSFRNLIALLIKFHLITVPPITTNPQEFYSAPTGSTLDQGGGQPRCPSNPQGLVCSVNPAPGTRGAQFNGCGPATGPTHYLIPNLNFVDCCDHHDLCYDNCFVASDGSNTWEGCNNAFRSCNHDKCKNAYQPDYTFFGYDLNSTPRWACNGLADFYADVVGTSQGKDAFAEATRERCVCNCEGDTFYCGGLCVSYQNNDNNNCGFCGHVCPKGQYCAYGKCYCPLLAQTLCASGCWNLQTDPNNCGSCGTLCSLGTTCQAGVCLCPAGQVKCPAAGTVGTCTATQTDVINCGSCGNICPVGGVCTSGNCSCPSGTVLSGKACIIPPSSSSSSLGFSGSSSSSNSTATTSPPGTGSSSSSFTSSASGTTSDAVPIPSSQCTQGSIYSTPDANTVLTQDCSNNYVGFEAGSSTEVSFASCMHSCAENNDNVYGSCVGISYNQSVSLCSFKYGILVLGKTSSSTMDSARVTGRGACIDGITQWGDIFLPSSGNSYTVFCAVDNPGDDTAPPCNSAATSTDGCAQDCTNANTGGGVNGGTGIVQCVGATYVPPFSATGNCCLKTSIPPSNFVTSALILDTVRFNLQG